jgi:hypothetical protein
MTRTVEWRRSRPVDIAPMGYPRDDHKLFPVVHRVDNAMVTDADPKVVATSKFYCARRSWIDGKTIDRGFDAFRDGSTESAVCLDRLWVKADVVVLARY